MNTEFKHKIGLRVNLLLLTAALFILNIGVVFANTNGTEPVKFGEWDIVGPSGGDVRTIAIDPKDKNRLYISTLDGQIHTSADSGVTWKLLVNLNSPQLVLDQLIVDLQDSKKIYTSGWRANRGGGFFKSSDGGLTWKEARELKSEPIHAMAQSSFDPNVIFVGTANGIWVSKDSGDNWEKIKSETMPLNVDSLAIDPRSVDTIYAGTTWRAYKSTDSGKSWRLIKEGMIDDSDVFAITIDRVNPDHIVASACSGIYESQNAGEKWAKIQGIPSQSRRTRDILQHPSKPGTIFAATTQGFWMTSGKSWVMTTQRDLEINSVAVHPDEPNRIFIGTNNYGVMISNDGGKTFNQANDNFTSRFTYSITADFENSNRLYAMTQNTATGGGFFFISNDGGTSWQQAKNLEITRIAPYSFLQDKINPNTLYLGTNVGMFRSADRGISWTQLLPPKPPPVKKTTKKTVAARRPSKSKAVVKKPVVAVVTPPVDPLLPSMIPALGEKINVLANTEDGKNGILAGTDKGIYRTYDVDKGWEKVSFGEGLDEKVFVINTSPLQPQTIWVGTAISGVIVSRDNGTTWQKVPGVPEKVPVSSIAFDPKNQENIYVGTTQTLYLSRDGGKSWIRRGGNLPLGDYASILISPKNSKEIFVASALESDGGIFFSDDMGMNWKRVDSKDLKLPSRRVWTMIFDPNDSNRIFAGTHSSGVYRIERTVKAETAEQTPADGLSRPRIAVSGN